MALQCRTCGDHDNLSLLDPEHASLLPQLAAGCSVCHDCDVEIKHWSNFLHRFQTSQTRFQQVLHTQQTDVQHPLEKILPKCRVVVPKLLECDTCCFYTNNKTQLATHHMQAHHRPSTSDESLPKSHAANEVRNSFQRKCGQCGLNFIHSEMLAWHTEFCHGPDAVVKMIKINYFNKQRNYQCVLCKTVCIGQYSMVTHLSSRHKISKLPFPCNFCEKQFSLMSSLKKHQLVCKNNSSVSPVLTFNQQILSVPEIVACEVCNKKYDSKVKLRRHRRNCHPSRNQKKIHLKCRHCNKSFLSYKKLFCHCHSTHPGKNVLQCEICKAEFYSYDTYMVHKKYKHSGLVFTCNICSATFSNPKGLRMHVKTVHSTNNDTSACKYCSAKFKARILLVNHMRDVHLGPIVKCEHCKYYTRRKVSLILHLRNRHLPKLLACKYCSAKFNGKQYLNQHVKGVHTGSIVHCDYCKYSTRRKSNLIQHLQHSH